LRLNRLVRIFGKFLASGLFDEGTAREKSENHRINTGDFWWAWVDLNHRPRPYQYCGHWSRAKNLRSRFRYFDFRVTTRRRRVHRGDDTLDMQAQYWPSRITEHDERDCANRQVLLVAHILVGGDEHIKSGGLSGSQ
jgi:hypothetical protein